MREERGQTGCENIGGRDVEEGGARVKGVVLLAERRKGKKSKLLNFIKVRILT